MVEIYWKGKDQLDQDRFSDLEHLLQEIMSRVEAGNDKSLTNLGKARFVGD